MIKENKYLRFYNFGNGLILILLAILSEGILPNI